MNINYKWLKLDSYDELVLEKFCETKQDIDFCFWVDGNLSGCDTTYEEVVELITNSLKYGEESKWGGNNTVLEISPQSTCIFSPMKNIRNEYDTSDFLNEIKKWRESADQIRE